MAVATEISQVSSAKPPPNGAEQPKKHAGGRPKKEQPPPPDDKGYEITGDLDFWLKLANFSTDDWSQHVAYLFRTAPIIDRKQGGRPSHLQKYCSSFEREDIMREHGSGSYRIDLCQVDPSTGKSFRVAQERFTIVNPKFPPNVPPGDWVDDKSNENWKWGTAQNPGSASANYPPGFNMDKIIERDEKMFDRAMGMAKQFAPPPKDDTILTTLLTKLIDVSLKPPPTPPAPDTSANDRLFTMMNDQLKETREELREMRKNAATPVQPKGILEQVKELKPVISEFADMFAERTGNNPWWQGPLEKVMESIPDVIDLVKTGQQQQRAQAPPPPQWNAPQQLPPASQPAAPPPQGPPPPATAAATAPQPDQPELSDEQKQFQAIANKWGGFILFIAPQMIEHFKKDEENHGGYYFRDWFLEMHGRLRWADIRREIGAPLLISMIAQHPALNAELAPPEARTRFIEEFFTMPGEETDDFEPDDDDPIEIGADDAA